MALARVAQRLLEDADELIGEMNEAILSASPALASDPAIAAETEASTAANFRRWAGAVAAGQDIPADPAPEALAVARSLVRRGIELEALLTAYRRGQNVAWRRWMEIAAAEVADPTELVDVLERSSQLMFAYVDRVLDEVLAQVAREREELLGGALARRTETVRLILDGAPVDPDAAAARLGYDLRRRHVALVLWADPPGSVQGALERAALALAGAAGAGRPLTLPAGTSALWAWLAVDAAPDPRTLRAAIDRADPHVHAAVGPLRAGVTGFRRSHAGAVAVQRLVARRRGDPDRLTTYEEAEVVALAAQDADRAAEFTASVLGPLAAADAGAARLRETVRVWLEEGGHAPRTARRLHLHRNTVLHRVARAEELLGHPLAERRLALHLALELDRRLGLSESTAG